MPHLRNGTLLVEYKAGTRSERREWTEVVRLNFARPSPPGIYIRGHPLVQSRNLLNSNYVISYCTTAQQHNTVQHTHYQKN